MENQPRSFCIMGIFEAKGDILGVTYAKARFIYIEKVNKSFLDIQLLFRGRKSICRSFSFIRLSRLEALFLGSNRGSPRPFALFGFAGIALSS